MHCNNAILEREGSLRNCCRAPSLFHRGEMEWLLSQLVYWHKWHQVCSDQNRTFSRTIFRITPLLIPLYSTVLLFVGIFWLTLFLEDNLYVYNLYLYNLYLYNSYVCNLYVHKSIFTYIIIWPYYLAAYRIIPQIMPGTSDLSSLP